jgi:hypothetical protein
MISIKKKNPKILKQVNLIFSNNIQKTSGKIHFVIGLYCFYSLDKVI